MPEIKRDGGDGVVLGVIFWMDMVGLLREMCKAKSQRYLLLPKQ